MPSLAITAAAGIGAAGSLASGIIGANASKQAANTQAQAANNATALERDIYNQNTARLQPFVNFGTNEISQLENELPQLTSRRQAYFSPTMAGLEATPGYQFTKQQGVLQAQNALAGSQPGGAALKSGINYAEGLASTTYQNQFNNWQTQFNDYLGQNQQIYNMLSGAVGMGQNAAAQTGSQANTQGAAISNLTTGGAAASAAGTIGQANALAGGLGGASNSLSNAIGLSQLGKLFGNSSNALSDDALTA